jgi:tRNA-splicing ligase RtcB (3'-phosphate/5'-hydroxy nucleic acid ligase)
MLQHSTAGGARGARASMKIFGHHDEATIAQLRRCAAAEPDAPAVLCADGHLGYSMPIGGVVGYRDHISPSGVGYDIACGNLAVRTPLHAEAFAPAAYNRVADEIKRRVAFGMGRANREPVRDHAVFDAIARSPVVEQRTLLRLAREQLGTVGGGNHYVDLLEDEEGLLWVGVHFGSRGFGHKTATGFLNIAAGRRFESRSRLGSDMNAPPSLLPLAAPSGQDYIAAMSIAGEFAYAGREAVVDTVLELLGTSETDRVHNHHNFAWRERHGGDDYWVVRKGATPAFPGQRGFIGGSMDDVAVIVHGVDSSTAANALYSTVHGAGRVMSRRQAKKVVDFRAVQDRLRARGTVLRGAGADEAPEVYRKLAEVLAPHAGTIEIEHTLRPRVVVMAGADEHDPYKD